MLNDKYFEMAFADELHKRAKSDEFTKEALLGVKALLKGMQTYGKGVAKGVKSKLIKAKVGLQTGGKVTPSSYKVDAIGRITTKPGTPKKYIKQLEKAKTLERGGKSLRGKGAPKKVWPKMKAEAKADINTIKSKLPGTKVVKQTKKSPGGSSATFISAEEKLRSGAKKFKKNLKNQAWQVGAVGAVAGLGGYAAGTDEKTVTVVHKSASLGGAVLGSVIKQANTNVGGATNTNINSTTKAPPTIKTQPVKNALPAVKAPKLKKIAAPLPLRHLGKALKAIVGGKAQTAGKHVGHAAGSVGKSVAKAVKGTAKADKKGPWYSRGNIGKKLLENKKLTGAGTAAGGALATKEILD